MTGEKRKVPNAQSFPNANRPCPARFNIIHLTPAVTLIG